jgi:hypothetical protein
MEEVPLLKDLQARYANEFVLVGISIDTSVQRTDKTIKEKGMTWPVLADGKGFEGPVPTAYRVLGTPDIFVLDRGGRIAVKLTSAKTLDAARGSPYRFDAPLSCPRRPHRRPGVQEYRSPFYLIVS